MKKLLRAIAGVSFIGGSVFIAALASAAPTGSIFFNSTNSGGANVQLILNGGSPLNSSDTGWYRDDASSNAPGNNNYITGLCSNCGSALFRDFFVFNIPAGIAITSAQLSLNTFVYDSLNASETLTLFDVTTDLNSLLAGTGGIAAYNDLGSGVVYGSRVYTAADQNLVRTFSLDAAAIAAIQTSVGGSFALGGSLESATSVPEPTTLALLGLGLAGLAASRHRRQ